MPENRDDCLALDRADPLAAFRDRFELPEGVIYLDGNSLGPLPRAARERVAQAVGHGWGRGLIRSWNDEGWIDLPQRVGNKIARLVGAPPGSVIACDSTSVNLFKVLSAALALRPGRRRIVADRDSFPTDLYIAQGLIARDREPRELVLVDAGRTGAIDAALEGDTAVLMLSHADYRNGRLHDIARLTRVAHDRGALAIWDLAHSAGAMPVGLAAADADFAVGCGYKYLNGGPGAPAFLYVAPRLQAQVVSPIAGWFGHARPFAFETGYDPAPGIDRFACGTPPVLSMVALDAALDVLLDVDPAAIRAKSTSLTSLLLRLVGALPSGFALRVVTPAEPEHRGSQVAIAHSDAWPICQALIARGVIGDFRAPDLLRLGLSPLFVRHVDVFDAVAHLADVIATRAWDDPRFHARRKVT